LNFGRNRADSGQNLFNSGRYFAALAADGIAMAAARRSEGVAKKRDDLRRDSFCFSYYFS